MRTESDVSWGLPFENHLGLLKQLNLSDPNVEKPAVDVIRNYVSGNHSVIPTVEPQRYYTSHHHDVYNPSEINAITGYVRDQDGNPIKGAIITALARLPNQQSAEIYSNETSFTNDQGWYKIIPYNYTESDPQEWKFHFIKVTCSGCDVKEAGSWPNSPGDPLINSTSLNFELKKISTDLHEIIDDVFLTNGMTKNFKGWRSLTAMTSVNLIAGSTSNMTANDFITLKDGVFLANESEVHIYIDNLFPDCDEITNIGFRIPASSYLSSNFKKNEIEITFNKKIENDVLIYPNPSNSIFHVQVKFPGPYLFFLNDMLGNQLLSSSIKDSVFELNLSNQAKGVYFISVVANNNRITKKIVLN